MATITQILLGECMLNFVQYAACLHLSVQNVWGAHFFLDTLYMSSRLQLDVCNLSLGMRHLVNAYEIEASAV